MAAVSPIGSRVENGIYGKQDQPKELQKPGITVVSYNLGKAKPVGTVNPDKVGAEGDVKNIIRKANKQRLLEAECGAVHYLVANVLYSSCEKAALDLASLVTGFLYPASVNKAQSTTYQKREERLARALLALARNGAEIITAQEVSKYHGDFKCEPPQKELEEPEQPLTHEELEILLMQKRKDELYQALKGAKENTDNSKAEIANQNNEHKTKLKNIMDKLDPNIKQKSYLKDLKKRQRASAAYEKNQAAWREYHAKMISLQETLKSAAKTNKDFAQKILPKGFEGFGDGFDTAIFYNQERFKFLKGGTLRTEREVTPRACWALLEDKKTKATTLVLSYHGYGVPQMMQDETKKAVALLKASTHFEKIHDQFKQLIYVYGPNVIRGADDNCDLNPEGKYRSVGDESRVKQLVEYGFKPVMFPPDSHSATIISHLATLIQTINQKLNVGYPLSKEEDAFAEKYIRQNGIYPNSREEAWDGTRGYATQNRSTVLALLSSQVKPFQIKGASVEAGKRNVDLFGPYGPIPVGAKITLKV